MKEKVTSLSSVIKQVIAVLVIGLSVGYAFAAWQNPPGNPPSCNDDNIVGCHPPVNVSSLDQVKNGGLSVGSFIARGDAWLKAGVKISGGSPGPGKVLTSDAVGNATWQDGGGAGGGSITTKIVTAAGARGPNTKAVAVCPSGFVVTGGGFVDTISPALDEVNSSYPSADGKAWTCAKESNKPHDPYTCYAVCARGSVSN